MRSLTKHRLFVPAVAGLAWAALVALALMTTLSAFRHDEFDGLNNMAQIPLGLPWILIPMSTSDHVRDAWVAAGWGWLNAVLVAWWVSRWRRQSI